MRRLVPAALLLATMACAAGPKVVRAPAAPLSEAWGIAVLPVMLRFQASPYEGFTRGRAIAEQLSTTTGRVVYGPGEFRVDKPDEDDLGRATDLLAALKYSKTRRPEQLLGVRVVVEQRVTSGGAQSVDNEGRAGGRRIATTEVVVRTELLSMGTRNVVAELEGNAFADPFSKDLEHDPYPDVTRLTAALVERLVEIAGLEATAPVPAPGLAVVVAPAPALAWAGPAQRSLRDELGALDAIERDSRLLSLLRLLDPSEDRTRARLLRNAPHGFVVVAAEGAAARAGLQPNDLVLTADGAPLLGLHVLDRQLRAGSTKLAVLRKGEEIDVDLRVP